MIPSFFRENVRRMRGYVPGEQPAAGERLLKLNTNENPYPPSPRVAEALHTFPTAPLRLYPDPLAHEVRCAVGRLHDCPPDWVLCGNGSDDLLTILTRSFVDQDGLVVSFTPSYLLYETLAQIQGARYVAYPFDDRWQPPCDPALYRSASIVFLANPNSPSGTCMDETMIERLAASLTCPLVIDEAYADFAGRTCISLVRSLPNVIVVRTLSKSYSLAGIRFGYLIARPEVVEGLVRVKDSYNCDAISIRLALAALSDQEYKEANIARIRRTRSRVCQRLRALSFTVLDSETNFLWCTGGPLTPKEFAAALRARSILVRYLDYGSYGAGVRITIGTDEEMDRFLAAVEDCLRDLGSGTHERHGT